MGKKQVQVQRVPDGHVVTSASDLKVKLSLKNKPYTNPTLARSVAAGTITRKQAEGHNPRFAAWGKSRDEHGLPIDASHEAVEAARKAAKGKSKPAAKKAAAKRSTGKKATVKLTPDKVAEMDEDEMRALLLSSIA